MKFNRLRTLTGLMAIALLALAIVAIPGATAAETKPLDPTWRAALVPLETMPVQDYGFIRSAYTFGENHLMGIANRRSLAGMNALEAVLWLMTDDQARQSEPLLKVPVPELARRLGGKLISLATYRSQQTQTIFEELVRKDQERWLKPLNEMERKAQFLEGLAEDFAILPRPGEWLSPAAVHDPQALAPGDLKIVEAWQMLKAALAKNDPAAGGEAAQALAVAVFASAERQKIALPLLKLDVFYHKLQPFGKSAFAYIFAALFFGGALMTGRKWTANAGLALLGVGFILQLIGIVSRWVLAGRAPTSNMYESFTMAIAGMILIAIVFELVGHARVVGLGAAILGFIFMVLAHKAPIFDSQIQPLMPALQSSWLTYHVVTIMLSYSAFALSCFVSLCYLYKEAVATAMHGWGRFGQRMPSLEALDLVNYRIIAIGFPLLTLGVVFGAVWADTAWGRPWGFDPKETWSAITWLIYAIYLHARYFANWRGRRAAILALLGFVAVLFTYFGVNYLLPSLHSYV